MSVWAIVVAAGRGERLGGGEPKQYRRVGGLRVVDWSLAAAASVADGTVLVVPADRAEVPEPGAGTVVAGGATRSASVRAGLAAVPDDVEVVVVHDAARPAAPPALFSSVVDAVRAGADAAVPALPLADTVKEVDGSRVVGTPDRARLVAVQTPQAFSAAALRAAHAGDAEATDDAALVEAAGGSVVVVDGDPANVKVTRPDDLERVAERLGASREPSLRVGQGFDVHRFSDDPRRTLVLGGVTFDGEAGLVGHSDADAVAHAAADALLGAAGLGDLGHHFPDTDARWEGADSIALLGHVAALVRGEGWQPGNVDCAVICERPRLAPHRAEMERRLGEAVGAPVSVKGNRAEGLGALGRSEGVACLAVATVLR